MPNIVYALTNPAMPGMVKIGMTNKDDVQRRMNELYDTGVPLPFECVIAKQIEGREAAEIENALHIAFGPNRVNDSREFFGIEPEQVAILLQVMPGEDVTPRAVQQESELAPADRDAVQRWSRTSEQEFMESLDENGSSVFERILHIGKQDRMRIKWGSKGFSLNALSNGALIAVCFGYPLNSKYRQSIHTGTWALREKSNIPRKIIDDIQKEVQATGLFVPLGNGEALTCRIDRRLDDTELAALTGWLESVISRIREFENAVPETDSLTNDSSQ